MAVNPYTSVDYGALAYEQTPYHLKDKPVFTKYLQLLLSGCIDADLTLKELMQERSIDTATGEQLDVIGRIVGQPRTLTNIADLKFFGFDGTSASGTFSTTANPAIGGYWYSSGQATGGSVRLADAQYRIFIRAKIKRNTTPAYVEDVVDMLEYIFGLRVFILQNEGGTLTMRSNRRLSLFERACFDRVEENGAYFIPRPLGCKLVLQEPETNGTLGFLGTVGALGMVSLYSVNPSGGVFGSALEDY